MLAEMSLQNALTIHHNFFYFSLNYLFFLIICQLKIKYFEIYNKFLTIKSIYKITLLIKFLGFFEFETA